MRHGWSWTSSPAQADGADAYVRSVPAATTPEAGAQEVIAHIQAPYERQVASAVEAVRQAPGLEARASRSLADVAAEFIPDPPLTSIGSGGP
jgi:ElaB/YqjD/DUF883 family membrane-anchored ribosome-binding protein